MELSPEVIAELDEKLEIIFDRDSLDKNSGLYIDDAGFLHHETGESLVALLNSLSLDQSAKQYVLEQIINKSNSNQSLLLYTSIHFGVLDDFLDKGRITWLSGDFIVLFNEYFDYIVNFFSKSQLRKMLLFLKSRSTNSIFEQHKTNIIYNITEYRFTELKQNLTGINIEINKDKEEVKSMINTFGFDGKYNEFLLGLDKHFHSDEDNIEVAGLIGNFRQFSCDIIIDIAKEVASLDGETEIPRSSNPEVNSPIGHARDYLRIKFELTENEHRLINNFVNILHDEGGHAFLSSMEYFRLTKNIFIEIMLFLLSKLRDLKAGQKH